MQQAKHPLEREIKPSYLPTTLNNIQENQEIVTNMKGFYSDLGLRLKQQRDVLTQITEKSHKIIYSE
jgi:hypothetical protein